MPSASDSAYPRLKANPSATELGEIYTPNIFELVLGRTQEREIYARLDTASPSSDREVHLKLTRLVAASLTCGFLEGD
jgi:hypothetical protein